MPTLEFVLLWECRARSIAALHHLIERQGSTAGLGPAVQTAPPPCDEAHRWDKRSKNVAL